MNNASFLLDFLLKTYKKLLIVLGCFLFLNCTFFKDQFFFFSTSFEIDINYSIIDVLLCQALFYFFLKLFLCLSVFYLLGSHKNSLYSFLTVCQVLFFFFYFLSFWQERFILQHIFFYIATLFFKFFKKFFQSSKKPHFFNKNSHFFLAYHKEKSNFFSDFSKKKLLLLKSFHLRQIE